MRCACARLLDETAALRSCHLCLAAEAAILSAAASKEGSLFIDVHAPSAAKFTKDFDHHAPGIARLNHGSFGATPAPVLAATEACRARWLAQPDDDYFSGALDAELQAATAAAADAIGAPAAETALVENATVAAAIVFRRWSQLEGTVLLPANAYGGVKAAALAAFGPQARQGVAVSVPWDESRIGAGLARPSAETARPALRAARPRLVAAGGRLPRRRDGGALSAPRRR